MIKREWQKWHYYTPNFFLSNTLLYLQMILMHMINYALVIQSDHCANNLYSLLKTNLNLLFSYEYSSVISHGLPTICANVYLLFLFFLLIFLVCFCSDEDFDDNFVIFSQSFCCCVFDLVVFSTPFWSSTANVQIVMKLSFKK